MDKKTKKRYDVLRENLQKEVDRWISINENGCSDPAWTDGVNMNLVRNHIIAYKRDLKELCNEQGITPPLISKISTPPLVDKTYMCETPGLSNEQFEKRCSSINTTAILTIRGKYPYTKYRFKVRR